MIYFVTPNKQLFTDKFIIEFAELEDVHAFLNSVDIIECDTETTGFSITEDNLKCYQFGNSENQFVIDAAYNINIFKSYFENSSKLWLFQNFKFDGRFLLKHGIDIWKMSIYDTFLAECILTTGLENSLLALDDLVWKYCNYKLDKSVRSQINIQGLTSKVIKYAAEDVMFLSRIREQQLEKIKSFNLENLLNLENEVVKVFTLMEYHGVKLDVPKWKTVINTVDLEKNKLEKELNSFIWEEDKFTKFRDRQIGLFGFEQKSILNWASNQQKLDVCKKIEPAMTSVGDRELQKIKHKHPLIKTLIGFNKFEKLQKAFGKNFLTFVEKDGRIHPNIWQILSTGRISVSSPNLNQIPSKGELSKVIRSCFIPEKEYKIVGGDFSGMELRIIAEFSKDEVWLDAFKEGKDLHSVLCSMTFGIPIENAKTETPFKKGVTYRDVQKTINFGLAYGMSEFKLADTMEIPVKEAKDIINKFFKAVPKVERFLTGLGKLGKQRGFIKTSLPYGRIRWFGNWQKAIEQDDFKELGVIERASKNTPIQGTNGDIIKQALIDVQEEIYTNNWDCKIILAVYDEIQTECHKSQAENWKVKLDELMVKAAKKVLLEVPVVVDCAIHDYWQK